MSVSAALHVLRFHGLRAEFAENDFGSSDALLWLLTDQDLAKQCFGRPSLVRTPYGLRFQSGSSARDAEVEAHRDQCLSAFAELGLPLSFALQVDNAQGSLRDVLRDSVANFHLKQGELAWTALAYALYLPPAREWLNRYGETYSFDQLAHELMDRPLDTSSCGGTHLLYSLAILARVDDEIPVLSHGTHDDLFKHLQRCLQVAVQTQDPQGFWHADWNLTLLPAESGRKGTAADTPKDHLLMTGHLAELFLMLPQRLQVPEATVRRAAVWLGGRLREAPVADQWREICPYTHAAVVQRALMRVDGSVGTTADLR
jgi:hypothetical protein